MNIEIMKAYRRFRKSDTSGYMGQIRAIDALRKARAEAKNRDREFPRYPGDVETLELPRGERVEMRLEWDNDADIFEQLECSADESVPDDVEENASVGWQDRHGRVIWDADSRGRHRDWRFWESGYTLAQRISDRRKYMSRHAAWLHARHSISREFDYFLRILDDGYVGYCVTLYGADGEELEWDTCFGFEHGGDYAGLECLDAAEHLADKRADYWANECERARAENRKLRAAFSALAREYRTAGNVGPAVCDAIRAKMESLRNQYRANVRLIAGDAA